jgi:hypothetical protein
MNTCSDSCALTLIALDRVPVLFLLAVFMHMLV